MKIKVYETFESIQGESSFAGFPFFFIRLSGCNLKCSYCDTINAHTQGDYIEFEKIIKKIEKSWIKKVLITGGEPLLQDNVYNLMKILLNKNYTVLLETNGSILLDKVPESVIKIVDFKTPSSGMCNFNKFANVNYLTQKDEVKFVIGNKDDFNWSIEKISKYKLFKKTTNIIFSTVYNTLNPSTLAEWILKEKINVRLQIQLHKLLNLK